MWLNSGSVPVISTGIYTKRSIKIQRLSSLHLCTLVRCHGITAEKLNVMIYSTLGKWPSKLRMAREDIFLTYLMITSMLLNLLMPKEVLGSNHLDTQTHCVCVLWGQLPTMLWLGNTGLDSSRMKNLSACVEYTPSNQEDISFMNVGDLMGIGILDKTPLAILSCFWRLTQILSLS